MLTKSTYVYAQHAGVDIECDVYEGPAYPLSSPVFLFFHSGGLVGGARERLAPWIVQACYQRKWTLISADYRLLPQVKAQGLLEDASAAYNFARSWRGSCRRVIVAGASAEGFVMAALTAHHLKPQPLALFGITPITTFQHPFFTSSILLTPEPLTAEYMGCTLDPNGPVISRYDNGPTPFDIERLTPSGEKHPEYVVPEKMPLDDPRCYLYGYYLNHNQFPSLVGSVDSGYGAVCPEAEEPPLRNKEWPPTVIFHGDDDYDVSMDVSVHMAQSLGEHRIKVFLAEGQGHLFECEWFLEEEDPAMAAVREALECLTDIAEGP
ncbi:hypothetical protein jhhlp_007825 [Lomentospora prolificans]|uniref:Alpha/beta hydrolase fold-3 domain-containing protein n=1 Tax=Lomentospora prolificans TaxID=41688 RepID=A0A2N3N0Q8_9PEZI|nr:hypothetical protein jhhlp_007825 [Lomentospora prolificans]